MTNQDFVNFQAALGLSGKELAEKLGVDQSAISKWRTNREIPDYIAIAMEKLMQDVEITIPLGVLIQATRAAEREGIPFETFVGRAIRTAATPPPLEALPASDIYAGCDGSEPDGTARVAQDPLSADA